MPSPIAPVRWHPAKPSNYARRRAGHVPIAEVDHRMVGWLLGTRRYFTATSERPVSTHFGIGHEARDPAGALRDLCPICGPITGARGPLVIDQYVDLADTAYANGNYDSSGGWTAVVKVGGAVVNPNLYTYSIEHEDGAAAGRGIVTPHVRAMSVALSKLLHSGNGDAIRATGIRVGVQPWHSGADAAATVLALSRIPVTAERFVDHHRVAGRLKPYCWQPWLADPGYVGGGTQRAILAALAPPPPPIRSNVVCLFDSSRLRSTASVTGHVVRSVDAGDRATSDAVVTGGAYVLHGTAGRKWRRITAIGGRRLAAPLYSAAPLWRTF